MDLTPQGVTSISKETYSHWKNGFPGWVRTSCLPTSGSTHVYIKRIKERIIGFFLIFVRK